jgi:hypothetical protein
MSGHASAGSCFAAREVTIRALAFSIWPHPAPARRAITQKGCLRMTLSGDLLPTGDCRWPRSWTSCHTFCHHDRPRSAPSCCRPRREAPPSPRAQSSSGTAAKHIRRAPECVAQMGYLLSEGQVCSQLWTTANSALPLGTSTRRGDGGVRGEAKPIHAAGGG